MQGVTLRHATGQGLAAGQFGQATAEASRLAVAGGCV
jgi:hypothetical protein